MASQAQHRILDRAICFDGVVERFDRRSAIDRIERLYLNDSLEMETPSHRGTEPLRR